MPACRVCQGQLLCKVSSSQLPLLQRNEVYSQTRRKFSRLDANYGRTNRRKVEPLYRTLLKAGAIKKKNYLSPTLRCNISNVEIITLTASEEKLFENVDGRMPEACIYNKLTNEP